MIQYEQQLEDLIWQAYNMKGGGKRLAERGLGLRGYMLRQFKLQDGSIPDLITIDINSIGVLRIQVVELKRDAIDFNTLDQALSYFYKFREILWNEIGGSITRKRDDFFSSYIVAEIVLIGSELKSDSLGFLNYSLHSSSHDISVTPYIYDFDPFKGLSFQCLSFTGYKKDFTPNQRYLPNELVDGLFESHDSVWKNLISGLPFHIAQDN